MTNEDFVPLLLIALLCICAVLVLFQFDKKDDDFELFR